MENLLLIFIGIIGFGSIFMANVLNKHIKEIAQLKEKLKQISQIISDNHNKSVSDLREVWREGISPLQGILYQPLYEKGNTVYFYDETSKGVKEFKGKVIEIIQKCGDLPEYKILIGKESRVIHQNLITAWE